MKAVAADAPRLAGSVRASRALMAAVALGWGAYWVHLVASEWSVHFESSWGLSQSWAVHATGLRLSTLEPLRLLVFALLPVVALAGAPRLAASGWIRPEGWRPAWLLAAWAAVFTLPAAAAMLLERVGAVGCALPVGSAYLPCVDGPALLERVLAWMMVIAGGVYGVIARMRGGFTVTAASHAAHWMLVLGLAVLLDRWLAARASSLRRPVRMACAAAAAYLAAVLLLGDYLTLYMATLLLVLATLMHGVWWWGRAAAAPVDPPLAANASPAGS